jgi:hypothetical protein
MCRPAEDCSFVIRVYKRADVLVSYENGKVWSVSTRERPGREGEGR